MLMLFFLFMLLLFLVLVFLMVAYVVLLERKVLGYKQDRKGPNKVGPWGLLQPLSDGVSLFSKEYLLLYGSNKIVYYLMPCIGMIFSLVLLLFYPYLWESANFSYGVVMYLFVVNLGVYPLMMMGWSSCSSYSMLGMHRSIAQAISYEVGLSFLILCLVIPLGGYVFFLVMEMNGLFSAFVSVPVIFVWLMIVVAYTHRGPFDLVESESELVSGFNTEYGSGGFGLVILMEYMNIVSISYITVVMFFMDFWSFMVLFMVYFFYTIRASYPRMRYDLVMKWMWFVGLPVVILYFLFYLGVKVMV